MIALEEGVIITIPRKYWGIQRYNATLGHMVNHSFISANAKFDYATHPRFGPIRTIVAIRKIQKGEEILVDYGYSENFAVPLWYTDTYEKEMKRKWPGEFVYNEK